MNTTITSGQMSQFLTLLEQKEMTPERFQRLLSNGILADVCDAKANLDCRLAVQRGLKHIIDMDADPFIPDGWSMEEHLRGGMFTWDLSEVSLYLSTLLLERKFIGGSELYEELKDKPVLNANVLDYLLAHLELIPEEWKGKYIFFWGTFYRNSSGFLSVRCLYWFSNMWLWSFSSLDDYWSSDHSILIPAS